MGKLIPGYIRNKGIELYEQDKVADLQIVSERLRAKVSDYRLYYSLDDAAVSCPCDLFQKKKYCEHIAAIECYLKRTKTGREFEKQLKQFAQEGIKEEALLSEGEKLLQTFYKEQIKPNQGYELAILGDLNEITQNIWWTLKIRRLPDQTAYVIRNIMAFLDCLRKGKSYQIGKKYDEQISIEQFDEASQDLLRFLFSLIPFEKEYLKSIFTEQNRHLKLPLANFEEGLAIFEALSSFECRYKEGNYSHLKVCDLSADLSLFTIEVSDQSEEYILTLTEKNCQPLFSGQYLLLKDKVIYVSRKQRQRIQWLSALTLNHQLKREVKFRHEDKAKLALMLADFQSFATVTCPSHLQLRDFKPIFTFSLTGPTILSLQINFDYGEGYRVDNEEAKKELPFASHYLHEKALFSLIQSLGFSGRFEAVKTVESESDRYDFFAHIVNRLEKEGQVILSDELADMTLDTPAQVLVDHQKGLLDVSFSFEHITDADIQKASQSLLDHQNYFVTESGKLLIFDEESKKMSQTLQALRMKQMPNGHLKGEGLSAYQVASRFKDKEQVSFSDSFQQLASDLTHPEHFFVPTYHVEAKLREYQKIGVQWMTMLAHYGFGGILADDMGLGKTLQTITFLSNQLKENQGVLILAPASLVYNWQEECRRFAPHLDVAVVYGNPQQRQKCLSENHQVLITSYALFRQDIDYYQEEAINYLILDEAQVIKNANTKIAHLLRQFDCDYCMALSGTPIENNLTDIWSIFQIVLPGLLPSKREFLKLSSQSVSAIIQPFILRRTKEAVLPELPELIETTYYSDLAEEQKTIYLAQLHKIQEEMSSYSDKEIQKGKLAILSGITRLRQICDTPALFMNYKGPSGKLDNVLSLLQQLNANGKRVLVFSQFRGMLDLIEQGLLTAGFSCYKLTGSTSAHKRQEMMEQFNQGQKDVFLISLKAGGVGLNLTGADAVVLTDLWWNPAVEMQAISRAHRLGQKKNVSVYRLITKGTIEEKILELQKDKQHLISNVLDSGEPLSAMTVEDIKSILGIK